MNDDVLKWFAQGEKGISSEAMACAVMGVAPNKEWARFGNHPHDPDDFRRCVKFLEAVPDARKYLSRVAKLSPVWERLVDHWDEFELQYKLESPNKRAPILYKKMQAIGC